MRKLILWVSIFLCACSGGAIKNSDNSKLGTSTKVDYCLSDVESKNFIISHFSKPLEQEINGIDPSGASVLISMAINGRLNKNVRAEMVSKYVLNKTHGNSMISFFDIKQTAIDLGHNATGYNASIIGQMRKYKKIMAISTDFGKGLLLVVGIEDDVAYMLYPNSKVCALDFKTFYEEFYPRAIMLIN